MCCPAPLACGNHSGEAERSYGIGLKLFGFIPEPVFTFIPESCSESTRNTVRDHPGIAFILPRNPQAGVRGVTTGLAGAVPVVIDANGQLGTISSSVRFKEDIHDMGDVSSRIMRLRAVTFRYKQPYADGSRSMDYGLIAEEVAKVYPDLVTRDADRQIETVQYQKLTPMLLNELQKMNRRIEEQDRREQEQREDIHLLRVQLSDLQKALGAIAGTER